MKNNIEIKEKLDSYLLDFGSFTNDDFESGTGYYQHFENNIIKYKTLLLELIYELTGDLIFHPNNVKSLECNSIAGRMIDEMSFHNKELGIIIKNGWFKLRRIDKEYREWCQVYYSINLQTLRKGLICLNRTIDPIFRKEKIKRIMKKV